MGNDQKKQQASKPNIFYLIILGYILNLYWNKANQYHPDIVVVTDKSNLNTSQDDSNELNKLQYVPLFYPILKSSIELKEDQKLFQMNPDSVNLLFIITQLCVN